MPHLSNWFVQCVVVGLVILLAGPLLAKVPGIEAFPISLFGLTGPHTIRLIIQGTLLVLLCGLSIRAVKRMPDNGSGFSFVRRLLLPSTMLFVWIVTDNTLQTAGAPLIDQIGRHRYTVVYITGLLVSGLWVSTLWLANFDSLGRFFSGQPNRISRAQPAPKGDDGHRVPLQQDTEEPASATVIINSGSPPSTLGRYKVLRELGRGAMGVVYLGKDPTIQRFVAIKTMRLDAIDDAEKFEEVKARFFREAESTGRLSHPNIVTIFDAGEEQDLGYIAMEVLEGTTLKQWSRKPNLLPPDKLCATLATVAEALDYAHQQGVVHRDIKPANIMLTKDHVVKVMDFGIAKMASSSKTQTDIVLGTPTYMSPEQIGGKKVDGRSDIFSLGVVLFELLSGGPPFTADNVSALLFAIAHQSEPPLSIFRSDVPPRLQEAVSRALQKDPVHRYRRANEFAHDLRACTQVLAA